MPEPKQGFSDRRERQWRSPDHCRTTFPGPTRFDPGPGGVCSAANSFWPVLCDQEKTDAGDSDDRFKRYLYSPHRDRLACQIANLHAN